jgi:hypothetical protein
MLTGSAVLVAAALALSACGGSQRVAYTGGPDLVHMTLPAPLVKRLASEARGIARSLGDPSVKTAQVYGPDSRYLLVKASTGDLVQKLARERKGFYLIVLHGHFVCHGCSRPPGSTATPPWGKIATEVWSPKTGQTDFGISNKPVTTAHLGGHSVIQISGGKQNFAYAYELPLDPNHPENGQWSTFVRMRPVTVGYRMRGIFPREWVVIAVKPLPQDGQQAAIRGWRGKKNPIWHGRLVLRLAAVQSRHFRFQVGQTRRFAEARTGDRITCRAGRHSVTVTVPPRNEGGFKQTTISPTRRLAINVGRKADGRVWALCRWR